MAFLCALSRVLAPSHAFAQTPAPYDETTCGTKVDFFAAAPKNQAVYGILLSSPRPAAEPIRLELYSTTTLYSVDLGQIVFGAGPALVFVRLPNADVIDAVSDGRYDSISGFPEKCGRPDFQVSREQAVKARVPFHDDNAMLEAIAQFSQQTATYPAQALTPLEQRVCDLPYNRDVTLVRGVAPMYPQIAIQQGASGNVRVLLDIGASGDVARATISSASGNVALNSSALQAAKDSTYAPISFRCKTMGGQFIFHADFSAK